MGKQVAVIDVAAQAKTEAEQTCGTNGGRATFRRSAVFMAALGASESELSALADPRSLDRFELNRWRAMGRQYSGSRQTEAC